ncbi:hypothetical protein Tco_1162866 [Tanacetum coccineum]
MSTAKAEYVSLSACCAQVLWMQTQLMDYGFYFNKIPIYCDSKLAIAISCNSVQHSRTKCIDVRYHFIKEHVEKGTIELYFIKTDYQLADLFTKALPVDRFNYMVRLLGMRSLSPLEVERLAKSRYEALLRPTLLPEYPTRDFTMSTSSLQAEKSVYTLLMLFSDTKLNVESVPDVPKYDSKSDKESWGDSGEDDDDDDDDTEDDEGNDDDDDGNDGDDDDDNDDNDGNADDDSDYERIELDRDENPNLNQFNEEHEEEEENVD